MVIVNRWRAQIAGLLGALCMLNPASADTLLNTGEPGGGMLGYFGFDVSFEQSVAIAFVPDRDYAFDAVSLWLMSNDSEPGATLTISLQTSVGSASTPAAPSGTALETWMHATSAAGWIPVLETMSSTAHPVLNAGQTYWIVAQSSEAPYFNPVWLTAGNGEMFTWGNVYHPDGPAWQVGLGGGPPGTVVTATPVPEPAALALVLCGLPLVLVAARRRSHWRTKH